jgi:hypothetical protein
MITPPLGHRKRANPLNGRASNPTVFYLLSYSNFLQLPRLEYYDRCVVRECCHA